MTDLGAMTTSRLELRPVRESDVDSLATVFATPEVWHFPYGRGLDRDETEAFVRAQLGQWATVGFGLWVARLRDGGAVVGVIGLSVPTFVPEILPAVEVGWRLDPASPSTPGCTLWKEIRTCDGNDVDIDPSRCFDPRVRLAQGRARRRRMTIDAETSARVRAELTALMADFCRAVSFRPGELPPYERLHGIFVLGGKLIRNNGEEPEICTVAGFIEPRQHMIASGELTFFEQAESGHLTEVYGNVAHRFSTYHKRGRMDGVDFVTRGIISTQFVNTPQGWRMSSMAWDDERPGLSIPDSYSR